VTLADSRIDELRRRLERDPGSRLFAQLAEEHRKAGEHAEAIRVARAGLLQHPSYASARLTLGRALLDSGDPAGARVELEAALRDAPDNILASRFLGLALDVLGELGPALTQLQKTLKMAPGDRQLESQIASLQTRLRPPQSPPAAPAGGGAPAVGRPQLTAPSAQPAPSARPAPSAPPAPSARPAAPAVADAEDAEAGRLPPTIRIHMPGDLGSWPRPTPPPLPPTAAPPVAADSATTLPASSPREAADPFYESDVAPTLPTAHTPGIGLADDIPTPGLPAGAVAAEETVFEAEAQPPHAEALRAAPLSASEPEDAVSGTTTPFSSSTLAELYFRQGLVDQAVEVYRQVLEEAPGNERARSRLAELQSALPPADPRAARRAALERTIAGLEALLVVLQRR